MKTNTNCHMATLSSFISPNLFFLFFLASIISTAAFGQKQTCFELAIALDSLYDKSQGDKGGDAAQEFLELLGQRYGIETTDLSQIKYMFQGNHYLEEKIKIVFADLLASGKTKVDKKTELLNSRAYSIRVINNTISKMKKALITVGMAHDSPEVERYNSLELRLEEEWKDKRTDTEIITELQELIKNDTIIKTKKGYITRELPYAIEKLNSVNRKLEELEDDKLKLGSDGSSLGGLSLSTFSNVGIDAPVPIVIQAPGSQSLESSIIDGTSKWIAERMREELSMAFFDRFESWVEEKHIQILFPNTLASLESSITTDYALLIEIFKSAFEKDLSELPFHLTDYLAEEMDYAQSVEDKKEAIVEARIEVEKIDSLLPLNQVKADNFWVENAELLSKYDSLYSIATDSSGNIKPEYETIFSPLQKEKDVLWKKIQDINAESERLYNLQSEKTNIGYSSNIESEAFKILKYVLLTTKALKELSDGKHPTNLMTYMRENIDEFLPDAGSIKPAIVILDEISKSLVKTGGDGSTVWLSGEEQKKLRENPQLLKTYLGLITEDVKSGLLEEISQIDYLKQNRIESIKAEKASRMYIYSGGEYLSPYPLYNYVTETYEGEAFFGGYHNEILDGLAYNLEAGYGITMSEEEKAEALQFMQQTIDSVKNNLDFQLLETKYYQAEEAISEYQQNNTDSIFFPNLDAGDYYGSNSLSRLISDTKRAELANNFIYVSPYFFRFSEIQTYDSISVDVLKSNTEAAVFSTLRQLGADSSAVTEKAKELIRLDFERDRIGLDYFGMANEAIQTVAETIVPPLYDKAEAKFYDDLNTDRKSIQLGIRSQQAWEQYDFAYDLLLNDQRSLLTILGNFMDFSVRLDQLRSDFKKSKENGNGNIGPEEQIYLLRSSLEAFEQIFRITLKKDDETLKTVSQLSRNVLDAYTAVLEKDYDAIVLNIMYISNAIVELSYESRLNKLKEKISISADKNNGFEYDETTPVTYAALNKKEKKSLRKSYEANQKLIAENNLLEGDSAYQHSLEGYNALFSEIEQKQQRIQEIFKYGAFLAAVVESRNSEDIKKAIRAIALPAGSYNIKRRNKFNISLNAYPGITGGAEQAFTSDANQWAGNMGFTAPIGLGFNWGYTSEVDGFKYLFDPAYTKRIDRLPSVEGGRFPNGHSGSIYFSLIDLGAIVLYRFDNETDPLPEDIGFQQIFAPGLAYVHGFGGMPLSLMVGAQLSPQLRKIDEKKANSLRFNASLVVDLPMANFHTKRRFSRK